MVREYKMRALVFILSAALMLGGAISVIGGWDIIQIERGWTQVIAGTTAFAAGVITLALGSILRQLEISAVVSLQQPAQESAQESAQMPNQVPAEAPFAAAPAAKFAEPAIVEPVKAEFPFEAPVVDEPVLEATPRRMPWKREKMERPIPSAPEPIVPERPVDRPATKTARLKATDLFRRDATSAKLEGNAGDRAQLPPFPPGYSPSADTGRLPGTSEDWLHSVLEPAHSEPRFPDAKAPAAPPIQSPFPPSATSTPQEPEAEGDGAVVGRYEANGTRYALYADGSIEADTGVGVYRFSSITELKTFIDEREGKKS